MIHHLVHWIISSLQFFWQILYSVRLLIEGITRSRIALGSSKCFHLMQALLLVMPSTSSLLPLHLFIISWPDINYWCNILGFGDLSKIIVKLELSLFYMTCSWVLCNLNNSSAKDFTSCLFLSGPQKFMNFFGNPLCSISFQINNEPSCMGWPHSSVISGFNNGV
jgi:hypothetical protein